MKRTLDVLVSAVALLLLSPLLIVVAMLVAIKMGRPVLFAQQRPGLGGAPFTYFKFRSMTNERDEAGELLPDDQRLIPFGKFLRKTSLDELPGFFCVLRGDMSLVGPRPLLMRYLDRYSPRQARRSEVKPGFTGWAQIKGRNAISWEEKFEYDVWYVENQSFALDLKIMLQTIPAVLFQRGIASDGHATMPEFMGTEEEEPNPDRAAPGGS